MTVDAPEPGSEGHHDEAPRSALVTGGAGFIGSHLVDRLLSEGDWRVTVLDSYDTFYDPALKIANLASVAEHPRLRVVRADIRDRANLERELRGDYDVIVHLAARAGVRPSLEDPVTYQDVNVMGTQQLLELARQWSTPRFVFASSSSVYGVAPEVPWREDHGVLQPISPYASTKVAGELLGHVYAHLYGLRFVALRFFTVYGPRQRPDLAIRRFAERMLAGESIPVFGDGSSRRDYTYVGDTIQGVRAAMTADLAPFEIINLGNDRTVTLRRMIEDLEEVLGVKASIDRKPTQPGDVPQTWADISKARRLLGYEPATRFDEGLRRFAAWLRDKGGLHQGATPESSSSGHAASR